MSVKALNDSVVELISRSLGYPLEEIRSVMEIPQKASQGDRALPCFRWAKKEKTSPQNLAKKWKKAIQGRGLPKEIEKVESAGGYLNFYFRKSELTHVVLTEIADNPGKFGFVKQDSKPVAVIEFSSPNIAKPFSIGHLRSTNIGASLSRIFEARGWRVIKINHLGDWGTQFGKLMCAYRKWGKAGDLGDQPMQALFKLYVHFHEEEQNRPELLDEAREWFSKLEQEDEEAKELWEWFRELTLRELTHLYKTLNVEFDHYWGESFYIERLPKLFEALEEKNLTKISEDATIIDLEAYDLPPCMVKKRDESTLYMTRDLAAAIYRKEQFKFDRMIYVVGAPQRLHFQQVFKVLELMGHSWASQCEHIMFGHISFGDQTMSTRKGNVVFFSDVLHRAIQMARKVVEEKNPSLEDKESVAKDVALGAILFADVSSRRIKDVKFSWEEILSFDGETGPYLQYTYVRTKSLLRRYDQPIEKDVSTECLNTNHEHSLIRILSQFPTALERAERDREPFALAQYLIDLASVFNRFYNAHRILDTQEHLTRARMLLVHCVSDVMHTGLKLLGIPTPERM